MDQFGPELSMRRQFVGAISDQFLDMSGVEPAAMLWIEAVESDRQSA
jgi:hypothetical protein